jgi:hypothetical protein
MEAALPQASEHFLRVALQPGEAVRYWQLGELSEARYDVADAPMQGEMDPFFFLTKHKNFIPHEYPCRTQFAAEHRGKRPEIVGSPAPTRWWLPFGSPRVDLSGFWFRPTRVSCWASTQLEAAAPGLATVRLGTCGGAVLFVNGREAGWMAPYTRNLEDKRDIGFRLEAGRNEVTLFFDDLAERDASFFFQMDYLSGPEAQIALPVPVEAGIARSLEAILDGMRFDRSAYRGGDVTLLLPQPLPVAMVARVSIEGDAAGAREVWLPRGASTLPLGTSEAMPADFRHFRITLEAGGFAAARTLGVEICHVRRQGDAPASLSARIEEALAEVASHGTRDTVRAFARVAIGQAGADTDAMITEALPAIEDCHDCADFALVPLLWARSTWGDDIGAPVRARVDAAILGHRYWMDEPGNDVQWYFSENHALLFHTAAYLAGNLFPDAIFLRSGRKGAEQRKVGAARVRAWLDHFEQWEMAEFNSAPYFPIDLKGLTALAGLAPDADIRDRAWAGVVRLLEIVARSSHHGILTAAQGRSYEHSLRPGRTLELSAIARLTWGKGWYGSRVHALPMLAVCLRDHGLELPAGLASVANHEGDDAVEWRFAQGQERFAALYHYKGRAFAMGSAAHYRWGEWGYQETVVHLRIGSRPEAQIWLNHPGETIQFGNGRPSYWGGSGTLPRVHQYRGLAVMDYALNEGQPEFTHAWFPKAEFDAAHVAGDVAVARSGDGLVLLKGTSAFVEVEDGPTAGNELRLPGRRARWIVRVSDAAVDGDLDSFSSRFDGLAVKEIGDEFSVTDPEYGAVIFRADGTIIAEGRTLNPADWSIAGETTRLPLPQA